MFIMENLHLWSNSKDRQGTKYFAPEQGTISTYKQSFKKCRFYQQKLLFYKPIIQNFFVAQWLAFGAKVR